MTFFDQLGEKVSKTGQNMKNSAEAGRLSRQVEAEQSRISDSFRQIGNMFFEKNRRSPDPEYAAPFAAIEEALLRIADMQEQISRLRGLEACPSCGAQNAAGVTFCPSCGAKMPERAAPAASFYPEARHCVSCGAPLAPGAMFCTGCGTKA